MSDTTNIFEEQPDGDTVGGRISRARDASGLSSRDLAWRLGVKLATVDAWERDRSEPAAHRLTNLAGLLNVSLSWILCGVGSAPADAEPAPNAEAAALQMDRLKLLHAETGQIIAKLQSDLERLHG